MTGAVGVCVRARAGRRRRVRGRGWNWITLGWGRERSSGCLIDRSHLESIGRSLAGHRRDKHNQHSLTHTETNHGECIGWWGGQVDVSMPRVRRALILKVTAQPTFSTAFYASLSLGLEFPTMPLVGRIPLRQWVTSVEPLDKDESVLLAPKRPFVPFRIQPNLAFLDFRFLCMIYKVFNTSLIQPQWTPNQTYTNQKFFFFFTNISSTLSIDMQIDTLLISRRNSRYSSLTGWNQSSEVARKVKTTIKERRKEIICIKSNQ